MDNDTLFRSLHFAFIIGEDHKITTDFHTYMSNWKIVCPMPPHDGFIGQFDKSGAIDTAILPIWAGDEVELIIDNCAHSLGVHAEPKITFIHAINEMMYLSVDGFFHW